MNRRSVLVLAIGTVAVVGGVILLATGGDDGDSGGHQVLTAAEEIPAGTDGGDALRSGMAVTATVSEDLRVSGALEDPAQLQGRTIASEVSPGEQITSSDLDNPPLRATAIEVPTGSEAIAVEIPFAPGGAGYVSPGDRVNLFALLDGDGNSSTVAVAESLEVLDVSAELPPRVAAQRSTPDEDEEGSARQPGGLTYLLAVPVEEVEAVVQAVAYHRIYLTLPTEDAESRSERDVVDDGDLTGADS